MSSAPHHITAMTVADRVYIACACGWLHVGYTEAWDEHLLDEA